MDHRRRTKTVFSAVHGQQTESRRALVAAVAIALACVSPAIGGGVAGAETSPHAVDLSAAVRSIKHKHSQSASQAKVLTDAIARVAAEVPSFDSSDAVGADRYYPSLAAMARALATKLPIVANPFGEVHFGSPSSKKPAPSIAPRSLRYDFGSHGIRLLKDGFPVKGSAGLLDSVPQANDKLLAPAIRLAWLSEGMRPDAELALAAIERELDIDPGADSMLAFLEYWRNNDESFYEALDRTAGSPDGIFHYDSMLGRFATDFLTAEERKEPEYLKGGKNAAHDRFHESFLTVRKYRGVIEAVAWSLVLPADVALPARLARYDFGAVTGTALSVRDQVLILLADAEGDVAKVVEFVRTVLREHPLPSRLSKHHEYEIVDALAASVIAKVDVLAIGKRESSAAWCDDPAALNRHHDVAVAWRESSLRRARIVRDVAASLLGTP